MSKRSESLATKAEQSFNDLLGAVEASTPEQWATRCSDGEWTQGFAAFHAAAAIGEITKTLKGLAEGEQFPKWSMEAIDEGNAVQAKEHAGCTKAETIDLIQKSAPAATNLVRSLTDEQLDRKVQLLEGMPETTIAGLVEMAMVGHGAYHRQTITDAR